MKLILSEDMDNDMEKQPVRQQIPQALMPQNQPVQNEVSNNVIPEAPAAAPEIVPNEQQVRNQSVISGLIRDCWEKVDNFNSQLLMAENEGNYELVQVLNYMVSDTYVHIGLLEGLLQTQGTGCFDQITNGREETEPGMEQMQPGEIKVEVTASQQQDERMPF